jgi:hypothetical protein
LHLNSIEPAEIITNVGFVDFTPKKWAVVEEAIRQVEMLMGGGVAKARFVEKYESAAGEQISLYCIQYANSFRQFVQEITAKYKCVVINSPTIGRDMILERQRPLAFFGGVEEANSFNRSLVGAHVVDPGTFTARETYDAVHYTNAGNEVIVNLVKDHL